MSKLKADLSFHRSSLDRQLGHRRLYKWLRFVRSTLVMRDPLGLMTTAFVQFGWQFTTIDINFGIGL